MWMWTVGYSVGDMVYIAQTTADQKQATRFSKAVWVVALACVLAYTGYQSYECYLSYTNPDWTTGVRFERQLDFPTVLVCPVFPKRHYLKGASCLRHNLTLGSGTKCSARGLVMSEGRFKGHECVEFNGNASNIMTAVIDEHIFMQVQLTIQISNFKSNPPFAVVLYSASSRTPIGNEDTSFLVVPKSSHWAALTQNEAIYLHDSTEISFSASTSSTFNRQPGHEDRIAITFSYSTFTVGTSEQVVTFDWLSLICTVGGAATFACYLHEIAMILYAKSRKWCCPLSPGKDINDDGAEEEDDAHSFADEAQKPPKVSWAETTKHRPRPPAPFSLQ